MTFDHTPIDTLTVKFFRDHPGPEFRGDAEPGWGCNVGLDFIGGVGGFGATPLLALRDLCENIARSEGYRTDAGKLFLR